MHDSLIIGNDIDIDNLRTTEGKQVNITTNNSIVGYYIDTADTATLTPTASIIEQHEAGTVAFVQTTDPTLPGYYEAQTVTVNGRTFNVRGTSTGGEGISILGYHSGVATDLTMQQIADQFYTTVTTLDDTVDDTDGEISLREAWQYVIENSSSDLGITFSADAVRAASGVENVLMLGWRWSAAIAKDGWYYDYNEKAVVQNTGNDPVSGWLPGNWSDPTKLTEKMVEFNLKYDVSQWQYSENIPATSFYFDGTAIQENTTGIVATGWMPASWNGTDILPEDNIKDNLDDSDLSFEVASGETFKLDGTLTSDWVLTITSANPIADGIDFVNNGTIDLSDIVLATRLYQGGTASLAGTVTLAYLTGANISTEGTITISPETILNIRNYYDTYTSAPGNSAEYRIHHTGTADLSIGATDGKITTPANLLTVTRTIGQSIYVEDTGTTPGVNVASLSFFDNALPVGTGGATFTVLCGVIDVSSSFEFIEQNAEATGIKIKDATELAAGIYTVTVNYGNLSGTVSFDVLANVGLILDKNVGTATPQNVQATDITLATGTAAHF
ncbi:MAG: hypothetical protein Q4G59_12025, partial [Planctomycetia bacterium]|nr:hypothetical protein [Planctomycetia bacterium]